MCQVSNLPPPQGRMVWSYFAPQEGENNATDEPEDAPTRLQAMISLIFLIYKLIGPVAKWRVRFSAYSHESFDYCHIRPNNIQATIIRQRASSTVIRFQTFDSTTYSQRSFDTRHTVNSQSTSSIRHHIIQSIVIRMRAYS